MFQGFRRFLTTTHAPSRASDVPHDQGCWPCRLQCTPCPLESGPTSDVCSVCRTFNMKCVGVGEDFPMSSSSKRAAKAIRRWIAHPANRTRNVPPLDLSHLVPLVFTVEPVVVQEALERHANPPKTLTNSFNLAMRIASQARDLGKFGPSLTSIANHAFATCRLLLFRVPPDGALFPLHPIERDYRNVSILTAGLPVLSTILRQTSELLLKGPLDDASAMEHALEILTGCITQLEQFLEEARGAADVGHVVEGIKSILGVKKTTTLHGLDVVGGDGAAVDLGLQPDDGGTSGLNTVGLAPETREDEATVRNLELSLLPTSSDFAGTRPRVFGDDDLHGEHDFAPPGIASQTSPRSSLSNLQYLMPFRGPLSPRRRSVQSPSFLFHDSSSDESSTSIVQRPLTELVGTPLPLFPDYLNETADPGWDVALAVTSILENIPAVPLTLITPLTQVLDVVSGIRDAVKTMRDEKDECTYLLLRVLKFLHSFVDGLKGRNTPDDTPMASSLFTLKSNLMAIYADATRWSRLHLPKGSIQRDKIMTEISMHGDNLTDCLHTFQIITSITVFYPLDRVETITFPDPSVSARPLAPSERTPASIIAGLRDFFERPAGQAVFEQIGAAVQRRFEGIGLRATPQSPGSRSPGMTTLQTGHDRHVAYLTSQISELTTEVGTILPDISAVTDMKIPFVRWGTRWPQTGNPGRQLRETVSATLQLLNELHEAPHVELDSAMLSKKMYELVLNLRDLGLWDEALEVQTTVVVLYRLRGEMADLASSLTSLSACLWYLGRNEEALKPCEEAVGIFRPLVADRPQVFRPHLAHSLITFSTHLGKLGRHQEMLEASEEAVGIYRLEATDHPGAFLPYLAQSLHNFSIHLSEFGRHEEALMSSEEAISIYRPLVADRPGLFRPDLARSLNNLSLCLLEFGRHQEALGAIEEAMSIYHLLVADRPQVFRPDLARSLTNLSRCLSKFGRHEEALKSSEEALGIYRLLAADRLELFRPDLALSLNNLSLRLLEFGRYQEALGRTEEAMSIYRLLISDQPQVFRPDLARCLTNLSRCLSEFGRHEEALKSSEVALSIYRVLATDRPELFRPDLALSLNNLSICLFFGFGRYQEALKAIEEAMKIYHLLVADRPQVFHPDFARSLTNLSRCLLGFGRYQEALKANKEAVAIYRLLAADRPEVFRPDLSRSLTNFSHCLLGLGRREEALKADEEAVIIYRLLPADRLQVFRPDFARSLNSLSHCLSELDRHEEALKANEEAVTIYRLLATDRPQVFHPNLARSLTNLLHCLWELSHHEEALKANEEAVTIYRLLVADQPQVFHPDLAHSLTNLSRCLSELGHHEKALKANEEAVTLYRLLAADRPQVFRPDFARSLTNLSRCLSELGRHEEALKANEEAMSIYRRRATGHVPQVSHSLKNQQGLGGN